MKLRRIDSFLVWILVSSCENWEFLEIMDFTISENCAPFCFVLEHNLDDVAQFEKKIVNIIDRLLKHAKY